MAELPKPIVFSANRTKGVSTRGNKKASVSIPGQVRIIHLSGIAYLPVPHNLTPICIESIYSDEFGQSVDLTKSVITLTLFVSWNHDGNAQCVKHTIRIQKVIFKTEELTYIEIPFNEVFERLDGLPFEDAIVGICIDSFVDQCGNDLLNVKSSKIVLEVNWEKSPTNTCLPCIVPTK